MKTAVLITNKSIPNSPGFPDVGRYLMEFLNDSTLIDFGNVKRKILLNGVIVAFVKKASSKFYKELLIKEYAKKTLVFSIVFVSDCLETTSEIVSGFRELFIKNGSEKVQFSPSLNSNCFWMKGLKGIMDKSIIK